VDDAVPGNAPRLPTERSGYAAPGEVAARRDSMAAAVAAGAWRIDAPQQETKLAGVRVLRFPPPDRPARGVVLHLHGGGFRIGCPEMLAPFAAALAARCEVEVICPDYRLAPEHPFPAGLADAHAVMSTLLKAGESPLILCGDSAGGALAAASTALSTMDKARPAGLVLLSAWLDLTVTSRSYDDNASSDPLFSRRSALDAAVLYLQGMSPQDPLASPLFGPVTGFPPTLISIGQEEVLADDGRKFYMALKGAGIEVSLHAVTSMEHVAVTRNLSLKGAKETFAAVADFIDRLTRLRS
jgi:monoterpene epsilon-lactone hydrolase